MKRVLCAAALLLLVVMPANAQKAQRAKDPLVVVQQGRYGYIDHNGRVLVRPQFIWGDDFENGYGTVYVCGRYVLIDVAGRLLPLQTPHATNELRPKKVGDKFGFVDGTGQLKISPAFDDALPFSDGMAAVRVHDKWGFIDATGNPAIPPQFGAAFYFREGVGTATDGDATIIIDKTGRVLSRGYELLHGVIAEGRIPVSREDKFGYLDLRGTVAIPLIYDSGDMFSEGLAPVEHGSKWGYIDTHGTMVIPFKFDSAGLFGSGLAPVQIGGDSGFIDHSGHFAFHLAFNYAPGFFGLDADSDVSRFWTKDSAFGYVNTSGKVIWGPIQGSPDHTPLLGWSEEGKQQSCEGIAESVRKTVAAFPATDDQ